MSGFRPPLAVKWSVDFGSATVSYPIIAGGRVFVIANCNSLDQTNLYALDAHTGNSVWGPVPIPHFAGCWSTAAYDNGIIFVVPQETTPFEGSMLAFDASDGHQIWRITLPGEYSFTSPPTALNGVVYTAGAGVGGTVYAVRESDGTILWNERVNAGDGSSPTLTSTDLYVSYVCPQTYRFDNATGQLVWHFSGPCFGGGGYTSVFYEGYLYVRNAVLDGWVYPTNGAILDAAKGTVVGNFVSQFAPAFFDQIVYYVMDFTVTAVNTVEGNTRWTARIPGFLGGLSVGSVASPPLVVNNVVYVGTTEGYLLGYDANAGNLVFALKVGSHISAFDAFGAFSGLGAGDCMLVVPVLNAYLPMGLSGALVGLAPFQRQSRTWPDCKVSNGTPNAR